MGAGGRKTSIEADLKKSYKRRGFGAQGSKKRKGRWGLRVAEDGENWSNSERLKPFFLSLVCKYQ